MSKRADTLQPTRFSDLFLILICKQDSASQNPVTNQGFNTEEEAKEEENLTRNLSE